MEARQSFITQLEELSLNAWPAIHTLAYDGWILRFSEGYSRRANSCHPLYSGEVRTEEKISACRALYSRAGLDTVFKMTDASLPSDLDMVLARKGYARQADVSVQTLPLPTSRYKEKGHDVITHTRLREEWLTSFASMNRLVDTQKNIAERMLRSILPDHCYASILDRSGSVVACGLAVLQNGYIGLYDIITDREHRRMGLGEALTAKLLNWGISMGAEGAYLQVVADNTPAVSMYSKLGFREAYRYWYRSKSPD